MRTVFGAVSRIIPGILLCVLWSQMISILQSLYRVSILFLDSPIYFSLHEQSNGILLVEPKIREAPEMNKLRTIKGIL